MIDFKIKIINQQIIIVKDTTLVSGSQNVYKIEFEFSSIWDTYSKMAVFTKDTEESIEYPINNENIAIIPWEVLTTQGYLKIGVYGFKENSKIPTIYSRPLKINLGASEGKDPANPTPSENIIYKLEIKEYRDEAIAAKDKAQEYADSIKNLTVKSSIVDSIDEMTVIKTENEEGIELDFKIAQGIQGEAGYTPIKGIDYWTQSDIDNIQKDINVITNKVQEDEDIRIANEDKRIKNENIRINNEDKRDLNETERVKNENIRNDNETVRINNEDERINKENIRDTNENARINNEKDRILNENTRQDKEIIRIENENARTIAEENRKINEKDRNTAENNRNLAENTRISNEEERASNETIRKSNENIRITSESTRISNETTRQNNEETRKTNENIRITNEQGRVTAENGRAQAEIVREQEQEQFFVNADNRYLPKDIASGVTPQTEYTIESNAINYKIYGNSAQATRSGKNILPFPYFFSTIILAGVTFTVNDDGTVILNGTSTSSVDFLCAAEFVFSKPGTYSYALSQTNSNILGTVNQYDSNTHTYIKSMNSGATTFQITENDISDAYYYIISIYIKTANAVFNNVKCSPQLEMSSEPTSYEQYGASPSPEFPSEVQSVGDLVTSGEHQGEYVIQQEVYGKNLFNKDDTNSILSAYPGANSTIVNLPNGRTVFTHCLPNTTYTVSKIAGNRFIVFYTKTVPAVGTQYFGAVTHHTNSSITITTGNDAQYIGAFVYNSAYDTSVTEEEMIGSVQIELGSTATAYEPYHEPATITTYLDEPLRKIGNYADYIDYKSQKVIRNVKEEVLDGSEVWGIQNIYVSTDIGLYTSSSNWGVKNAGATNRSLFLRCTHAKNALSGWSATQSNVTSFNTEYTNLLLNLNKTVVGSTITEFTTWLSANNIKVYYVLATPTEQAITLEPLLLKDGTNNILTNTTTLPSNIEVTYYQNPTDVINELRQAIIALQSATE